MRKLMRIAMVFLAAIWATPVLAQSVAMTRDQIIRYTPDWKGERFADGRPKVPDSILKRMKSVTLEEAWARLRAAGPLSARPPTTSNGM